MNGVRPTVRCLLDDLADTVTDAAQRSSLLSGSLPHISVPLDEVAHPIIEAANVRYSGAQGPERRELLRDVRDQAWAKCRHSARWRGIVLWRADLPRWLCFAGWHESGDPDDVYNDFTMRCTTGRAVDSSAFLPERKDELRILGERAHAERMERDNRFRAGVLSSLLAAVASPGEPHETELPSGSMLRITLLPLGGGGLAELPLPASMLPGDPIVDDGDGGDEGSVGDENDWMSDLLLQVVIAWDGGGNAEEVVRAQEAIPGIAVDEWNIAADSAGQQDPVFFTIVDADWIQAVLDKVGEHGSTALSSDPLLVLDAADGQSHVARSDAVSRGYVNGEVLRSVCGRRFVPSKDPGTEPTCATCRDFKVAWELIKPHL